MKVWVADLIVWMWLNDFLYVWANWMENAVSLFPEVLMCIFPNSLYATISCFKHREVIYFMLSSELEVGSESIKIPWSHSPEAYQSLIAALFVKRSINCDTLWLRMHFSSFWWRFGPQATFKIKISTLRRPHGLRQAICWFYLILIPWVTCPKHQLGFRL